MLMFTCLFSLYLARTSKEAKTKIFKEFRSQITTLKDKSHEQTEEISLLQEDIKMYELENMALTSSTKIQEELKNAQSLRLQPIKTCLEKKLAVLVDDLFQITKFDPALESLLEIGQSAQKDFMNLSTGVPWSRDNKEILLEDLINTSIQGLGNLIFSKNISYEINIDSAIAKIQGDPVIVQIIIMNILYKSIERLKTSGKIKISVLPTSEQRKMVQLDVWDDGYNFDDSKLLQYAATNKNEDKLLKLGWHNLEALIDQYGGQVYQKNHSAMGNNTSIYLPVTQVQDEARFMEQFDNVIPFVKA